MLLLPAIAAANPRDNLARELGHCAAAWQREDYAGIIAYEPTRVIDQTGGRAKRLRELKAQFVQARALGAESLEAIPGKSPAPRPIGRWLASVVPVTAILHGPHLDLTQETHVLALSSDQGRHWSFLPLYQVTPQDLGAWFPELAGKIPLPADPEPRLEAVF